MEGRPGDLGPLGAERVEREQVIETPQSHVALGKQWTRKFTAGDTTPNVANLEKFVAGNTASTNVTNFSGGQDGQTIKILGDGFTSVVHDAFKIITNEGTSKLLAANKVFTFTHFDGVWVEDE